MQVKPEAARATQGLRGVPYKTSRKSITLRPEVSLTLKLRGNQQF